MDKAVLEIGAGTGLVSVVATLLGKSRVFLTSMIKNSATKKKGTVQKKPNEPEHSKGSKLKNLETGCNKTIKL